MSFDVNPLNNTPQLRAPQHTQDGGAGNLGYFQGKRKKKENQEENDKSIFKESNDSYTFTLSDAEKLNYSDTPILLKIIEFVKIFFGKLLHQ